jgi:hypothetical protein
MKISARSWEFGLFLSIFESNVLVVLNISSKLFIELKWEPERVIQVDAK